MTEIERPGAGKCRGGLRWRVCLAKRENRQSGMPPDMGAIVERG